MVNFLTSPDYNCRHAAQYRSTRVSDDARLLPVLLKKLKDWYRPHMDKTLKKLQDSVINCSLGIIYNMACQDDKREGLRQLGVTGVMVNFLTSPDRVYRTRRYLDRQDNPLDAATTALLTRSATEGAGNREGDFMMLIIHQKYGLIVVRVTLVGFRMDDVQDIVKMSLCADQLPTARRPCDVINYSDLDRLIEWWKRTMVIPSAASSCGRSPQVYRHHFCFMEDEMDEAIDALVKVARDAGGQLYLLIDEAGPPKLFPRFCQQLVSRVPTVHLWATALEHGLRPACLTEVRLTIPHRCPWAVLQEISASRALRDEPGSRQYRDVLILCVRPQDDSRDEHGKVTHASGLVRGLRARGVPVQVVRRLDPDDVIRDVALAINNRVTVADYTMVAGLERRVVVGMGAEGFCSYSNMLAMSRSSGHLLWIDKARAEVKKSFLATQNSS
nr:hypothetical protein BaRGS_008387 [Batillaria attramentaria]